MSRTIIGARIRERRRSLGITQAELARRVGISASYINLIERNKRGIAGPLLRRTAQALDLELEELDGAAERQLLETLDDIALLPAAQSLGVEVARAGELIGRFPGWSRAMAALARSEREATDVARALADRLSHDPFLAESVHRMLTGIAAVRSAAEILVTYDDIEPERHDRFHRIIEQESRDLSNVGEALASYFDKKDVTARNLTPLDEVEALFDVRGNRFDDIEQAVRDLDVQELRTPSTQDTPAPRKARASELAARALGTFVDDVIAGQPQVITELARSRAREALLNYATGAILAPMPLFAEQAQALQYDLEALMALFSIDVETTCHRLAALPEGDGIPRFGYFRVNAAGTIIEVRNLPNLVAPRHSSACPLWVLYRAQQLPETVIRQRVLLPTGHRFVFLARARSVGVAGFGKPRHYLTDMLAVSEADSQLTVYAPDTAVPVDEVGPACRICPRRGCAHRVADPLVG